MSDAKPGHMERLQSASGSSDLRVRTGAIGAVDYVLAAGLASARIRQAGGQCGLWRGPDGVAALVQRMGKARRWRLCPDAMQAVARAAYAHHAMPVCPHCKGSGKRCTANQVEKACSHCKGTGTRPVQREYREEIEAVLAALRDSANRLEREVSNLMR